MGYNIPALEKLIDEFRKMPSVGTKSAERMAFYVLGLDDNGTAELANAIVTAHEKYISAKFAAILPKMKSARFAVMKSATDLQFAWLKVRVMS